MLPVLKKRVPQFFAAKVTHSRMGHYEFYTFDHDAIMGRMLKYLICCFASASQGMEANRLRHMGEELQSSSHMQSFVPWTYRRLLIFLARAINPRLSEL
ncbi:hypothetical protein DER45DRAFT_311651 [Fusarium avenaceum]|nr:hypothetical protein DER45DRAFT_311651 [Fusarium avenaceum]